MRPGDEIDSRGTLETPDDAGVSAFRPKGWAHAQVAVQFTEQQADEIRPYFEKAMSSRRGVFGLNTGVTWIWVHLKCKRSGADPDAPYLGQSSEVIEGAPQRPDYVVLPLAYMPEAGIYDGSAELELEAAREWVEKNSPVHYCTHEGARVLGLDPEYARPLEDCRHYVRALAVIPRIPLQVGRQYTPEELEKAGIKIRLIRFKGGKK